MIAFDHIPNARELGGVKVQDGRHVKNGLLFRTAHLAAASDSDIEELQRLGIRGIVDFRSEYESGRMPDKPVPGAWHTQIEVLSLNAHLYKGMNAAFDSSSTFEEGMSSFIMTEAAKMICDGFYISYVDDPDSQASYARFFRELLSLKGQPILWHCTQGKDRTGLAAAFLLFALGADRQAVIEEFAISNIFYARDIAKVKAVVAAKGGGYDEFNCVDTLVGVTVPGFMDGLDWIDKYYGGMDSYLTNQLELSGEDIAKLREYYLE